MITTYHRPHTLADALALLTRPAARPLGGGTILNQPMDDPFEVVDLQDLGLNKIHKSGERLEIGATASLQSLLECPHIPDAFRTALRLEVPFSLRNMGTVAGALVSSDGRSPFAAVLLAVEARCKLVGQDSAETLGLGDLLPLRAKILAGRLITLIDIPLNISLAYEQVARTPADRPIVCTALARWASGRTRLVIGGWGASPVVAMDGKDPSRLELAARNAAQDAGDEWASAAYRCQVAAVLAGRCARKAPGTRDQD